MLTPSLRMLVRSKMLQQAQLQPRQLRRQMLQQGQLQPRMQLHSKMLAMTPLDQTMTPLMRRAPQDVKLLDLDESGSLKLSFHEETQKKESTPDGQESFLKEY